MAYDRIDQMSFKCPKCGEFFESPNGLVIPSYRRAITQRDNVLQLVHNIKDEIIKMLDEGEVEKETIKNMLNKMVDEAQIY